MRIFRCDPDVDGRSSPSSAYHCRTLLCQSRGNTGLASRRCLPGGLKGSNRPSSVGPGLTGFCSSYFAGKRIRYWRAEQAISQSPEFDPEGKTHPALLSQFPAWSSRNSRLERPPRSPRNSRRRLSNPHDNHKFINGHDRARIRFRSVHRGVWEHGGYQGTGTHPGRAASAGRCVLS